MELSLTVLVCMRFTNTAEDSGRWNGKSSYTSKLELTVLK